MPALAAAFLALLAAASCSPKTAPMEWPESETPYQPAPGEGVLCAMAMHNLAAEVGRRCFAGRDPAFQADMENIVARIDAYVLANSDWTEADLAAFKRAQSKIGQPEERICQADLKDLYERWVRQAPEINASIDTLLARPESRSGAIACDRPRQHMARAERLRTMKQSRAYLANRRRYLVEAGRRRRRIMRVFLLVWISVSLAMTGAALLDQAAGLGWGYDLRDARGFALFAAFGCAFWLFGRAIEALLRYAGRATSGPDLPDEG